MNPKHPLTSNLPEQQNLSKDSLIDWLIVFALLLLALAVRLPTLGTFTTLDEDAWAGRSQNFLAGLLDPTYVCGALTEHSGLYESEGLECTLRTGHPGVTTMWAGSAGIVLSYLLDESTMSLFGYTRSLQLHPIGSQLMIPIRMPIAIWMGVWVIIVYWLVWKLFHHRLIALITGLLLALNPFQIAHARVLHHDALEASFMTLSFLTALFYWGKTASRGWLIASGFAAGFAFLSKSPALFLAPFMVLLALWMLVVRRQHDVDVAKRRIIAYTVDLLFWFGSATLVVVLVWPAMWVLPLDTLRTVFRIGNQYATEGHIHYFLAKISSDPGILFYPVMWLLRSSPVVWLGILLLVGIAVRSLWHLARKNKNPMATLTKMPIERQYLLLMALYVVLFVIMMTLVAKKQDRYILPVYPIINILAAIGLVKFVSLIDGILSSRLSAILLAGFVIVFQGVLVWVHYPYYFSYYNPVLGGTRGAERLVTIGWGEGLDLAAAYLNQKPNAEQLKVHLPYYSQSFMPYFLGQQGKGFRESDYTIFYRNQVQRNLGDQELWAYFNQNFEPEYVVNLHGVDYALVYAVPLQHRIPAQMGEVDDNLVLYGYRQIDEQLDTLSLQLVWRDQGLLQNEENLWIALTPYPSTEQLLNWVPCQLISENFKGKSQKEGGMIESTCIYSTKELSKGVYTVHIGLGSSADSVIDSLAPAGELGVIVAEGSTPSLVTPAGALDALTKDKLPAKATPLHISYGEAVSLIGSEVDPLSSELVNITLFWQASQELPTLSDLGQKFHIHFQLVDNEENLVFETSEELFLLTEAGEIEPEQKVLADQYQLQLPSELLLGKYRLLVRLVNVETGQRIPYRNDVTGQLENTDIQLTTITIAE